MDGEDEDRHSLVARVERLARERDLAIDRAEARRRGVVHTPGAIARWIARAADEAVRRELGRPHGLASDDVVIVDPATGPGVFLAAAIEVAGASPDRAPRACVGLDVDPRAIALASAALGGAAARAGWALALSAGDALASLAPVRALEDDDVVRVVIGNPPWAARSANRDARLTEALLDDFRRDGEGRPLGERRIGVLSDDYVRFVRWGAELVRRARRGGVLAMVTNASFVDGPVHRGMRAALARWMDRVDVIDLGGSSLVARERGAVDENVFGVRPAAAITIAVRRAAIAAGRDRGAQLSLGRDGGADEPSEAGERRLPRAQLSLGLDGGCRPRSADAPLEPPLDPPRDATLRVATLRGTREEKLDELAHGELALVPQPIERPWRQARASAPRAYASWPSLAEWMPFHREGLQTNRDELAIALDRDALLAKLARFARGELEGRAGEHWDPEVARRDLRALLDDPAALDAAIRPIAYRPLDERVVLAHRALCHRPRGELARALDASGLALITARKDRGQRAWRLFGACRAVPDNCWLSTRSSCRARAFPLRDPDGAPNLDPDLRARAEDAIGAALEPETFAAWALAWMACAAYREACDGALRDDYPRIPPPPDARALAELAARGRALIDALTNATASAAPRPPAAPVSIGHHDLAATARSPSRAAALAAALAAADAALAPRIREALGITR